MTGDPGDSIEVDEALLADLSTLHASLRQAWSDADPYSPNPFRPGGLLRAFDLSAVTQDVLLSVAADEARLLEGFVFRGPMVTPTSALVDAGAAVSAGLFDCPYGTRPSKVDWRYVPPPHDFIELRCLHGPPPHCFEQRGSRFHRIVCP